LWGIAHQSATPAPPVNAVAAVDHQQLALVRLFEGVQLGAGAGGDAGLEVTHTFYQPAGPAYPELHRLNTAPTASCW